MSTDKKPPPSSLTETGALYSVRDFKAGTHAVEKSTDSAWQMWVDANQSPEERKDDPRYARTAPASLSSETSGFGEEPGSRKENQRQAATVEDAMTEARRNNRVCPRPNHWQALYDMLPDKKRADPPLPLIGLQWNMTASINKRTCLRQQLEWAADHGALDAVMAFLWSLPEDEWFHMND